MAEKEKVVRLCLHIAQMTASTGAVKVLAEKSDNMYGLCDMLSDDECELGMKMKIRHNYLPSELAKKTHFDEEYVERMLDHLCDIGLVEFNWENEDHHKQYNMPIFILGSMENMVKNDKLIQKYPQIADMFYEMGELPLAKIAPMVPPGGAGIALRVIPLEQAIPDVRQAVSVEQISYWLKKYTDHYALTPCECRRAMRIRGEGCGELEDSMCIMTGDYADYLIDTGKGRKASYEEVMQVLNNAEKNGYMHEVANIDGPDKSIGICNCHVGSCFALRCSQLYNAPNLSASAYRAHVDMKKCTACGKCVEVCPAGAAKLGQKLVTKNGPISYPKQELPDETAWDESKWNRDYRNTNMRNCHTTGTSPCKAACPAHISVQGYIELAKQGRYREALELIKMDNPLPAVCGAICNKRCEEACTRCVIDKPVAIDEIKRYIADLDLKSDSQYVPEPLYRKGDTDPWPQKIAVIGAGPAGLSCAYFLARMGYANVTVFDKAEEPGGMLMHGIPSFRLPKDTVRAEIKIIEKMGVHFVCNTEVGKDITIDELRKQGYKAFYIAIGCAKGRKAGCPGEDVEGVVSAVDFLAQVNKDHESMHLDGDTVVIGGGNVAMDVARSAVRLSEGRTSLYCLELRDTMPASSDEIEDSENEGVMINPGWGPKEILSENGHVTGVVFRKCLSVKDPVTHRFSPVFDESKTITVPCSNVLLAIGQASEWGNLLNGTNVQLKGVRVQADQVTYQTDDPDVFVGGDVYYGPRFAIDAIACGREGAESIHRHVHEGQSLTLARNPRDFVPLDRDQAVIPEEKKHVVQRQPLNKVTLSPRSFEYAYRPFTEEQIKAETSRCIGCGMSVIDSNKCIGCGICTTRCRFDAIHLELDHPEARKMVPAEDTMKEVLPYALKRAAKITIHKLSLKK